MIESFVSPSHLVRPMTIVDYDDVIDLLQQTEGVTFRVADSRESTQRYLLRNPGLSFVASESNALVGCIMSGHDGRRGYLQHLAVLPTHRKRGIAFSLVECCLAELAKLGLFKSHVDVLHTNTLAQRFWEARGWQFRTDIRRYSFVRSEDANA